MKILLCHPGTQYSLNLADQLYKNKLLNKFYSCFLISSQSRLYKYYPAFIKNKLINRTTTVPSEKLKIFPLLEFRALLQSKLKHNLEDVLFIRNRSFQEKISEKDIQNSDVVIGFDTSSWILAGKCKKLGVPFILDVSIAHPKEKEKIFSEIAKEFPEWSNQVQIKKPEYVRFEQIECDLADLIVVPSNFVKRTYINQGIPEHKIKINPFGTDISYFIPSEKQYDGKITFLFFGGLSARKGLPFLLKTWEKIDSSKAELIIAGFGKLPKNVSLPKNVINLGLIPKNKRSTLFNKAHVFVFPSYFEGFAQVQIEAAASGLPIIGTYNSGAEEIIENGKEGFIITPGDSAALAKGLEYFINNPDQIFLMGNAARIKAEKFTWNEYGNNWLKILTSMQI